MVSLEHLEADLNRALRADRHRLRQQVRALETAARRGVAIDGKLARLAEQIQRSVALRDTRRGNVPPVRFDNELPVTARRSEIAAAIHRHPVVIVSGETGSGKSTQLPKICLEMGRGVEGLIGHTQPRRIAARWLAARVADELDCPLGKEVGFKIRFTDATSPKTYIKLMTDGILLAESQNDPFLDQYDTIILDEAHERSLNIDFLIGYLKRLLPKRRDLKLIITSATIDSDRFARHFAAEDGSPAPVIQVSGRTYPVEVRYRPPEPDEETGEIDIDRAVLGAVEELASVDTGDILIFMPTERDILETAKALRGRTLPKDGPGRTTEILPLYARLPASEQQRAFQPHAHRRIVIATNVAESSLTVPGIRYVIDTGTARISRYSARSKTQRLPIEPVSRASADQRKGRCGRVAPGVCIRLYGEEDYEGRDRYTAPEIQRTNLASVILQTKAFKLGPIERFPFLDPPKSDAVGDGYKTLFEIGALDAEQELTEIGRRLARLPVDPRIGRMILAAAEEGCLSEVLVIAAALAIQDPRDRPLEKQQAADQRHAQFADPQSDFLACLKLWRFYHHLKETLSRNQLRKACRENFLSFNRLREWSDIHLQLLELVEEAGIGKTAGARRPPPQPASQERPRNRPDELPPEYQRIHRAILTGLLSNLALRGEGPEYSVAGGGKAFLWPGSGIFEAKPKWVMGAELVETTRRYLRTAARVNPGWIEPLAPHLLKRTYTDVHWDPSQAAAMAFEKVSLFALVVVPRRRVRYSPIDPQAARQMLIQNGLVEGQFELPAAFFEHNQRLIAEVHGLEDKLRRRDLLRGQWAIYEFYDQRIPPDVVDGHALVAWLRRQPRDSLHMTEADLLAEDAPPISREAFPDTLPLERAELPIRYQFEPGSEQDGLTLETPLAALNQLDPQRLGWLVPGLLEQKVLAMIRALPKPLRRLFVPAPESAKKAVGLIRFGEGSIEAAVAAALSRIGGVHVSPEAFRDGRLPPELEMKVRVVGAEGQTLAEGADLAGIRRQLGQQAAAGIAALDDPRFNRDGLLTWDFDELPERIEVHRGGMTLVAYPMLVDRGESVSLRLGDSPERAGAESRRGLRRLFSGAVWREVKTQVDWLPQFDKIRVYASAIAGFDVRRQACELIVDRALLADAPPIRSRQEYDERLDTGRRQIPAAVQDVAGLLPPLFEGCYQARLAMEKSSQSLWQYAVEDVRDQWARLVGPRFLTEVPWAWLQHYPRYFRAMKLRLESLPGGALARDRKGYLEEFQPRWQRYLERAGEQATSASVDDPLQQHRWMLEEYRVSLFAQRLGTALAVSGKRLDAHWEKVLRQ